MQNVENEKLKTFSHNCNLENELIKLTNYNRFISFFPTSFQPGTKISIYLFIMNSIYDINLKKSWTFSCSHASSSQAEIFVLLWTHFYLLFRLFYMYICRQLSSSELHGLHARTGSGCSKSSCMHSTFQIRAKRYFVNTIDSYEKAVTLLAKTVSICFDSFIPNLNWSFNSKINKINKQTNILKNFFTIKYC